MPQSEAIPGSKQVQNSAGGFSFAVDCWKRLERFLVLGNAGGSYYATERALTRENAPAVLVCAAKDAARTVRTIVDISRSGRAPKNDPAIFALAIMAGQGQKLVGVSTVWLPEALSEVCRTGTHLFQFIEQVQAFRGWGRALRNAVAAWYSRKSARDVAYQVTKYQQRNGWSHRDVLRKAHAKPPTDQHRIALGWAAGKVEGFADFVPDAQEAVQPIYALEHAKVAATVAEVVKCIREYRLVRECVPTQWLNSPEVWDALLEDMPMTAMIRNLGKMSAVGLLKPLSAAAKVVCERLSDVERLKKARVHPFHVLLALDTYGRGRGVKGSLLWTTVPQVLDALNEAFYLAFSAVEPTGKRWLLGVDVSGSMGGSYIAGTAVSCRTAAACMAMVALRTEPQSYVHGFCGGDFSHLGRLYSSYRGSNPDVVDGFVDLGLSKSMRLDGVCRKLDGIPFGPTDCAVPMRWALKNHIEVDCFVILTDSETWCGQIHPMQALREYREKMGIPAKLVTAAFVSNGFTIGDPDDGGCLDVVGMDANVPAVIADFVRG